MPAILILIGLISLSGCAQESTPNSDTQSPHDTGWWEATPQSNSDKSGHSRISEDPDPGERVFDEEDAWDMNVSDDILDELDEITE